MEEAEARNKKVQELLEQLARTVVNYFYQPQELLVVDVVLREKCVSEKRLEEVLKFDIPLLRMTLATLKNDKILTVKSEREVNSEGKRFKVNSYYVKLGELVNVVKYKLDNVRNRLETLERDLSKKTSFRCVPCNRQWTDMESGELFNQKTLKFHCRNCRQPVTEDTSEIPTDTHQLVLKYNEQLGPVYDILQEVEFLVDN